MSFKFKNVEEIGGLVVIEPAVFPDLRGYFFESYKKSDFKAYGIDVDFVQDNHSSSKKGVIRGLHFQVAPRAQGKLVSVPKGRVWDVAVDVREGSATFLKWHGVELSGENKKMFYIPPGFAHGFLSLEDDSHVVYKCTDVYAKECEQGIRYDDPEIGILWQESAPIVSEKDMAYPYARNLFKHP